MDARSFKENGYQSAIVQDTRAQKMDKENVIIKFLLRINAIDFIIYEIKQTVFSPVISGGAEYFDSRNLHFI